VAEIVSNEKRKAVAKAKYRKAYQYQYENKLAKDNNLKSSIWRKTAIGEKASNVMAAKA
jgi:hypothetical protein